VTKHPDHDRKGHFRFLDRLAKMTDAPASADTRPSRLSRRRHVAPLAGLCLAAMLFGLTEARPDSGQGPSN
jgi:ferric-dicitrate binding protein FerR (iron transport regulator)